MKKGGPALPQEYWHMKKKIIYEKVSKLLFAIILQKKYEKSVIGL